MSRNGKMTAVKLQRERAVAARRREKLERRTNQKETAQPTANGEDPDLAGIQLGPQPLQDWQIEEQAEE